MYKFKNNLEYYRTVKSQFFQYLLHFIIKKKKNKRIIIISMKNRNVSITVNIRYFYHWFEYGFDQYIHVNVSTNSIDRILLLLQQKLSLCLG